MARSKKEYICTTCNHKHIKWEGVCRNCKSTGTLKEVVLVPPKPASKETQSAKSLRRRSINSERNVAKRMQEVDGPDPKFRHIASSTGRVGFITGMRVDAVSKTYVTENKNRKIPTWMAKAWVVLNQRAEDFGKNALLHIEPPNIPRNIPINGVSKKLDTMAIITQSRHEDLIRSEQALVAIIQALGASEQVPPPKDFYKKLLDQAQEILSGKHSKD